MLARLALVATAAVAAAPLLGTWGFAAAEENSVSAEELREAVSRGVPLLVRGAVGHREERTCFACHQQFHPLLAMTAARDRGFQVEEEEIPRQVAFIAEFLDRNRAGYLEGRGQGGQADMAGYALVTLELGGWPSDATTAAVTSYLLQRNADLPHWRANAKRPPTENGDFTTTYVALRGLLHYATEAQREAAERRREQVRSWLLETPAKDQEDRVFRLLGLQLSGAPEEEREKAAAELLARQREDGGWAQLDRGEPPRATESDPYATGSALVALHRAGGLAASAPAYQRGLRYLLDTQLEDGSWHVVSRSKPFQKYYETGFPHGTDQFISSAASGWAATALALALEPAAEQEPAEPAEEPENPGDR